jgi:hypothetical protein
MLSPVSSEIWSASNKHCNRSDSNSSTK